MNHIAKNPKKQLGAEIPAAVNEAQAAKYIGISPSTLAVWRKTGIGPKYKSITVPGKKKPRYLYPVKLLDEWLETSTVVTA